MNNDKKLTRRESIAGIVLLPAFVGLIAAETSTAQAKGSQAQFKYQKTPNGSKKCSNCKFFIPGKTATANGSCKIVDGTISPNGYCVAWSAKSS
jgi:hypothetical protein